MENYKFKNITVKNRKLNRPDFCYHGTCQKARCGDQRACLCYHGTS